MAVPAGTSILIFAAGNHGLDGRGISPGVVTEPIAILAAEGDGFDGSGTPPYPSMKQGHPIIGCGGMEMPRGRRSFSTVSGPPGMKGSYVDLGSSQPHNLGSSAIQSYRWSGLDVHLVRQQVLAGPAWHRLSSDRPILSVVVNEIGGDCEARLAIEDIAAKLRSRHRRNGHISLIPGGTAVWGYSDQIARVDEVRLILDVDSLLRVMGGAFPITSLSEPSSDVFTTTSCRH